MEKIGQGLQFKVYDLGNGRVLKLPTSRLSMFTRLLLWTPSYFYHPFNLVQEATKIRDERTESLLGVQRRTIPLSLLAHPLISLSRIEQDKVTVLKNYLSTYEQAQTWIDKYISFIFECWKHGFSERTYNLTVNNGVNSSGEIVLLDFGELTFSHDHVAHAISIRRWEKAWSFTKDLDERVKTYYSKQMREQLTLENLDTFWRDS